MNYKTYGQLNSPTIVINSQLDIDKLFLNSPTIVINSQLDIDKLFSNFITTLTSLNISITTGSFSLVNGP